MEQRLPPWLLIWKRSPRTPAEDETGPRSRRARLLRMAGGLAAGLLAVLVLLPTLISWGPGAMFISRAGSWAMPGRLELGGVSCGWFSELAITGLRIHEPDGSEVLAVEQASVSRGGLLRLAVGGRDLGAVNVAGLRVTLAHYADGSTSFERAFGPTDPDAPTEPIFIPPSLRAAVTLHDAEFRVAAPDATPVTVQFTSEAQMEGGRRVVASFDASVMRGAAEAGRVRVALDASDYANADGLLMLTAATFDVQTQVRRLDLAALDQMLGQPGLLTTLLGPTIELTFNAKGTLARSAWQFEAESQWLTATGGASSVEAALVSEPGTAVRFRLTPAAWARLVQPAEAAARLTLVEPVDVQLALNRLWIANTPGQWPGLREADLDMRLTATDMRLVRAGEAKAGVTLAGLRAQLASDALGEAIRLDAGGDVHHGEHHGQLRLTSSVHELFGKDNQPQLHRARMQGRVDVTELALSAIEALAGQEAFASHHVGPTLNGTGQWTVQPSTAAAAPGDAAPAWALDGEMQWATQNLRLHGLLAGHLHATNLTLAPATGMQLDIAPDLLTSLFASAEEPTATLLAPIALSLHVDRAAVGWDEHVTTTADVRLTSTDIPLQIAGLREALTLRDLELRLEELDPTAAVTAKLAGNLDVGGDRAALTGHLDLSPVEGATGWTDVAGELALAALPTRLIVALAGVEGLPPGLIDPTLDKVAMSFGTSLAEPVGRLRFAGSIAAAAFDASLAGRVSEEMRLELEPGVLARYRMAPAVLQQLLQSSSAADVNNGPRQAGGMMVDKPVQFVLTLKEGAVGLTEAPDDSVSADLSRLALALRFAIDDASMTDAATQRQLALRNFAFDLSANGLADQVTLVGGFELTDTASPDARGHMSTRTTITNLLDPQMRPRADAFTLDSQTQATLPLGTIDAALEQGSRLVDALGEDARFNLHMRRSPGDPIAAGLTLATPEAVDIEVAVTQPASAEPCAWTLTAQAKPLLIDAKAHGSFDPQTAVLTMQRYESRTLVASRQVTGALAALPRSFTDQLEAHGIAIAATLRMRDGRFPLRSWRDSELDLLFNADAMVAYYQGKLVPIDRSLVRFSMRDRVASLDHLAINAMRGNVTLTGLTSLADERFESAYQLRLHDLDAHSAVALAYPPDTLAGRTQGTINGEIRLHGPLARIAREAGGGGEIDVTDGVLAPLPIISDILQFLRVTDLLQQAGLDLRHGQASPKGDDTARVAFDFIGDAARFKTIEVTTKVAKITGDGTVGFDESLDLNLVAELLTSWINRPIKVTGTINEPQVDPFSSSGR